MFVSLLLVLATVLSPVGAYNHGNQLYAQKDYAGAAKAYEQALGAGPNARVYYNLGNAMFKSGQIGKAILDYRRARYLAPRDADVRANLAFARNFRVDRTPGVQSPFAALMDGALHELSHREAALAAALAFALAMLALVTWIIRRWTVSIVAAVVCGVAALWCFASQQAWAAEIDSHPGVIVVREASAGSSPSEDSKQILQVHDGTEVRIREVRGDYLLIQIPGGAGGWIKKDAVERVY